MQGPLDVAANFHLVTTLEGHRSSVSAVKYEPCRGEVLLSASADRSVKLWKPETTELLLTGNEHEGGVNDVCWMGKGDYFCTASDDKTVGVWDSETMKLLNRCTGHTNYVFSVKSNTRGDMIVTGSFDETVRIWDIRSATCVREIPAHGDPVSSVDVSIDGSLIVSASYDGLCRIWSIHDGRAMQTIVDKQSAPISSAQFTPNGRYLLIASLNGRLALRKYICSDASSAEVVREFVGHVNHQMCLMPSFTYAYGTGGQRWIVCGSEDAALCVWSIRRTKNATRDVAFGTSAAHECCQKIPGRRDSQDAGDGHCDAVLCVHGHPQTPSVATGSKSNDCTIKIWTDC